MSAFARLDPSSFNPERELAALIAQAAGDGAMVSFTGLARPRSADGRNVSRLVLEYHPSLTVRSLEGIAAEALVRFDVNHVRGCTSRSASARGCHSSRRAAAHRRIPISGL